MHIRNIVVAAVAALWASASFAAEIFPRPLHITRVIEDPIAQSKTTVDEYLVGNVMISIAGGKTAILDYGKNQLTLIDRDASTYSISTFEEIAQSLPPVVQRLRSEKLSVRELPGRRKAGRDADVYEVVPSDTAASFARIEVALARDIELTREALEVVIGSRYPNARGSEHEAVMRAAGAASAARGSSETFRLPLEQVTDYAIDGETLRQRNSVVAIREELPPSELIAVPPGATRVESKFVTMRRLLEEVDRLPR